MKSFLEQLVLYIYNKHNKHLKDICFIVPNKRTSLFLKKYLAQTYQKALVLPQFLTIDEFAQKFSHLHIADNLTLLSDLFKVFNNCLNKEDTQVNVIDDFVGWGNMLLADFNDIDISCAQAKDVFSYLSEAKAIATWNLNKDDLTPLQKKYLRFYKTLFPIYEQFTREITAKGYAYQAHILRFLAENPTHMLPALKTWDKCYFVGFNALSKVEEIILDFFLENEKAELIADYDMLYVKNEAYEAGYFIRKLIKKYGKSPFHETNHFFENQSKEIDIIGIPKNVGQAKFAGLLLKNYLKTDDIEKTALVLSDEGLLFPVLNSIPEDISQINVTMGYPLSKSVLYDFFYGIIEMYDNANKLSTLRADGLFKININDFIKLIENPAFTKLVIGNNEKLRIFINDLKTHNKVFYSLQELSIMLNKYCDDSASHWHLLSTILEARSNDNKELVSILKQAISIFLTVYITDSKRHYLELEFLYAYNKSINKLEQFINSIDTLQIRSLKSFHRALTQNLQIPFSGEPLKGLQIMGLLESRNLDFENIILFSANEGILPASKSHNSFIPPDIRRHFNMYLYYENESIFAYHFYRLIQRAKKVFILYNTECDEMGTGEMSRFVSQIKHELPSLNSNIKINTHLLSASVLSDNLNSELIIYKTPALSALLKTYAQKGFSPTSLSIFLNCSLRFYLQYILKLKAEEEPDENVDAAILGSAIHDVLEEIYSPLINVVLRKEDFNINLNQIEFLLRKAFNKIWQNVDIDNGKNHLLYKVAVKFIANFLAAEKALIEKQQEYIVYGLEDKLSVSLDLSDINCNVNIIGKIDRIDCVDGNLRIIDYKTGRIDKKDIELKNWDNLYADELSGKLLQLLIYGFLYTENKPQSAAISVGFISLRAPQTGISSLIFPEDKKTYDKEIHEKVSIFLKNIIFDVFDEKKPFQKTKQIENCKYCDFRNLCNR